MALGFQNCCDVEDYFYVTGIPGSVSEFEIYYIETVEGETLCGTYVELPTLNYQPIIYDLVGMTAQTSCTNCILLNPCPTGITIDFNTQNTGIFTTVNECNVKTIFPFSAECVTVYPTIEGITDGSVGLFVTGGTPPYSFYSATTETPIRIGNDGLPINNVYSLYEDVPGGTYLILVHDYYGDNIQIIDCTIPAVPNRLGGICLPTNPEFGLPSSGELNLYITGGTYPYFYTLNSVPVALPLTNITAGTYTIIVEDSGIGDYNQTFTISCTLQNAEDVVYPSQLCMSFEYCNVQFYLNFVSASTYNYRPLYSATTPSNISVTGMTLYYEDYWLSSIQTHNAPLAVPGECTQQNTVSFNIGNIDSIQPTDSAWIGGGTFTGVNNISVIEGTCAQTTPPTLTVQSENVCTTSSCQASATITANSPNGGPFIYFVDDVQSNSPIFENLCTGSHIAQVIDGVGNLSNIVSFTVQSNVPAQATALSCITFPVNNIVNTTTGGNKKFTFKFKLQNISQGCLMSAKVRIIYSYKEWSPDDSTPNQTITPYTPSNTILAQTVTWTESTTSASFGVPGCSTDPSVILTWPNYVKTYESTQLINLTNNTIIELNNLGYSWTWGAQKETNPSYPGCKPNVFGSVTVQLFDFKLKTAALCPCLLPPNNITSSIAQVSLAYNNTTQVPNANSSPISPNCTF